MQHLLTSLQERGLDDLIPLGTTTHAKGRRLDVVWTDISPRPRVLVHNGQHCRAGGCERLQCGNHRATFGSADLDHDAVTMHIEYAPTDTLPLSSTTGAAGLGAK